MAFTVKICGVAIALSIAISSQAFGGELNETHKKELTVFGLRALGMQSGIEDVKKVLPSSDIEKMVATGINLNGHLCANVTAIRALKIKNAYEVTCVAYRGGSAKKVYILEALKGIASEL